MASNDKSMQQNLVISFLTLRQIMGILGILFPAILVAWGFILTGELQNTISDYYAFRTRDVFVGILFMIALLLGVYRGYERKDTIAGNIACVFALGVAFFPNKPVCWQSTVHFISASCLFTTLAYFSLILFTKTEPSSIPPWWKRILEAFQFGAPSGNDARTTGKRRRNRVYVYCGLVMMLCLILCLMNSLFWNNTAFAEHKPVFWFETVMVVAFGISWLVKGEGLRLLNDKKE